ncbi:MAG TPA: hypothetical protein VFI72_18450, partial [Candidatus Angelobacter sp.]|nr:hypothetical protein [Candidatus Angelobacter sp.]
FVNTLTTFPTIGRTRIPIGSNLFITPSIKLKLLPESGVSPFASAGGGWARYGNEGAAVNTWALQFGGGVDFKSFVPFLAFRAEIRDVFTGSRLDTTSPVNPSHVHNLFIGAGLVLR